MREILFRAWNGKYMEIPDVLCIKDNTIKMADMICGSWEIGGDFNYPIMQYTGLTDVNGVKIFEGDIVEFTHETGEDTYEVLKETVKFNNGLFNISWAFEDNYCDECNVLGNIYENPELLNLNN